MPCPGCGKQIPPEHKFCRYCGSSLDLVAKAASGQSQAKVTTRMVERRMNRALFWGLIVLGVGVTLLANAQDYQVLNWLGVPIFLAGIGLAIYGAFTPQKAEALTSGQSSEPKALNQAEMDSYLPPKDFSEPVPSVTERTTELLGIENRKASK